MPTALSTCLETRRPRNGWFPRLVHRWRCSTRRTTSRVERACSGSSPRSGGGSRPRAPSAAEVRESQGQNEQKRLHEDVHAHLRLPRPAFLERDRDFDDAGARLTGPEGRLDLEGVAARMKAVEIDLLERVRGPGLVAARKIAEREQENDGREDAAAAADQ